MANCTLDFAGADDSPILLAECGCIIPTDDNGMTDESFVSAPQPSQYRVLMDTTDDQCPQPITLFFLSLTFLSHLLPRFPAGGPHLYPGCRPQGSD